MTNMDFNSAGEQRGDLIPDGTVATVHMTVKPGNAGEGGWCKRSKSSENPALMLELEFTVVDGPHAKRKLWENWLVDGTTDGQKTARDISFSRIRAVLESVNGVKPDDESEAAKAKRRIGGFGDLDGLRFPVKIGVEKGKENYKDRNVILEVITPDRKAWVKPEQVARQTAAPAAVAPAAAAQASAPKAGRPAWA